MSMKGAAREPGQELCFDKNSFPQDFSGGNKGHLSNAGISCISSLKFQRWTDGRSLTAGWQHSSYMETTR